MKKKPGFSLNSVCGEKYLIAEGVENIDFSSLICLNETSAYLWETIKEGEEFTAESMAELLVSEYEVDKATALADTEALIASMLKAGVIE